jgi:hypothetical protein
MILWRRSRTRCLHCALIALAIQGMTPDPQDLTSSLISRILQSIWHDCVPGVADEGPRGGDASDETPDEVCTLASACVRLAARSRVNGPPVAPGAPLAPGMPGKSPPRPHSPREAATICRRLASLCRFTC